MAQNSRTVIESLLSNFDLIRAISLLPKSQEERGRLDTGEESDLSSQFTNKSPVTPNKTIKT